MVDIQPTATQPISDDQELAKVLAGVSQQADTTMQFEETPAPAPVIADPVMAADPAPTMTDPVMSPEIPAMPPTGDDLSPIKNEAISELRPLVDKLDLPPEEKFDTYLLLLRSTDDRTLVAPAHAAAQNIADEAKKAQAFLDIIKEIDYLSNPQQPAL
ncbi:hypothetical protein E6P97_02355 [Patescibacteria group bacterium]|nr:MAG: hypothetical protein E6P97_02355 [Patescibacteria group bacterium]